MYKSKRPPLAHQTACLNQAKDLEEFAFLVDMGGGKTKITIDNVGHLFTEGKIDRWLCIAPNGIYKNWIAEIEKDLSEDIGYKMWVWKQKDLVERPNPKGERRTLSIFLINVEALSTKKGLDFAKRFVDKRTLVSIDESTTIKNHKAKRSESAVELGRSAGYRRILSGYPTPQNQLDLFMQFNFLNPNIFGIRSYYAFRNEYAVVQDVYLGPGRPSFPKVMGPKNMDQLKEKIAPYSYRIRKDECLDLPPKVYQVRQVEMGDDQQKAYDEMKSNAVACLESQELVTADLVLTQLVRLHQITCGFAVTEDGEVRRFKKNPKIEELKNILEQTSDKVIVWATYVNNIEEIYDELRKGYDDERVFTYYGGTKQGDRERAIEAFQNGNAKVFIGNPSTAGFGLTLTASSSVVYVSNSYNLEHRLQSEDRAHRIGQNCSVLYTDLICQGTVDEKIVKALTTKKVIGADILGDEWRDWIL